MEIALILLGLLVAILFVGLADLTNKVAALERQAGINRGGKHGNTQGQYLVAVKWRVHVLVHDKPRYQGELGSADLDCTVFNPSYCQHNKKRHYRTSVMPTEKLTNEAIIAWKNNIRKPN